MTIMVMGTDDHAMAVMGCLVGMGENVVMLDSRSEWHIVGNDNLLSLKMKTRNDTLFDSRSVKSFYWRSHDGVMNMRNANKSEEAIKNRLSIFNSWLQGLDHDGIPMFNSYQAWTTHQCKPYQNRRMAFILGSDDSSVMIPTNHYGRIADGMCVKAVQGGVYATDNASEWDKSVYATSQCKIVGRTYRVYVFPDEAVTYLVHSEHFDYRTDPECDTSIRGNVTAVVNSIKKIMNVFNWMWCGADVMFDDDNKPWLLDVNPSPMFLGFQRRNEVLTALCKALAK